MSIENKDIVEFWLKAAKKDESVMKVLFANKKYADSLFYGHLVLEKTLKAVYVQKIQSSPPFIHDLLLLTRKSQLKVDEDVAKKLKIITGFNINGRYDDYKSTFYSVSTKKYALEYLEVIKSIKIWLLKQI